MEHTQEDYENLRKILDHARNVCPPDEYQLRQNKLTIAIAHFLLAPYERSMQKAKDAKPS